MIKSCLDLLFPPLCLHCKEASGPSYLCSACWQLSALLDPATRCLHCFQPRETPHPLCPTCGHHPRLPFPRASLFEAEAPICRWIQEPDSASAFAGFAYLQFEQLEWELPDFIVPLLPNAKHFAKELSSLLQRPAIDLFQRTPWPLDAPQWALKDSFSEEEAIFLLLAWHPSTLDELAAFRALVHAFPKKIYLLTAVL